MAKITRSDQNSGLNIHFDRLGFLSYKLPTLYVATGISEYIKFIVKDFVVFVHNSSNLISSNTKSFYFTCQINFVLSLERTFIQKEPQPYSDCIDLSSYSSQLFDYLIEANYSYRQSDCLDLCIQQNILSSCGCYFPRYPSLKTKMKPCLNLTEFNCSNNEIDNFDSSKCISSQCPLECSSITYESGTSTGAVRFEPYLVHSNDIGSNITLLTASYSTLEYTLVTESSQTTFVDLLTQLGGSLGMFVSFSVFTLFESIEIFVLIFHALFCKTPKLTRINQE